MASKVPNALISVAVTPGHSVGIKLEYCSLTAIRTTSKTISAPRAKTSSAHVPADTTARNSPLNSQKGVSLGTPKVCKFL